MFTLIIAAMQEEIHDFLNTTGFQKKNLTDYWPLFWKNKILIVISGIGLVNSSNALTYVCAKYNISRIINIGTCGAASAMLAISDIMLIEKARYMDVDLTVFKYQLGELPGETAVFKTDATFNQDLIDCLSSEFKIIKAQTLSSDRFLHNVGLVPDIWRSDLSNTTFDMESAALCHIANHFKIPISVIRVISDNLLDRTKLPVQQQFDNNLKLVTHLICKILVKISDML